MASFTAFTSNPRDAVQCQHDAVARNSPHVENSITAATTIPIIGPITYQPVYFITMPPASTPHGHPTYPQPYADKPLSRSDPYPAPLKNRNAVKAFTTMPTPATQANYLHWLWGHQFFHTLPQYHRHCSHQTACRLPMKRVPSFFVTVGVFSRRFYHHHTESQKRQHQ